MAFEITRDMIRRWGQSFWCQDYEQFTCLAVCARRFQLRNNPDFKDQFSPCVKCRIRKANFHLMRRSRMVVRHPRVA